jgi:hypothetical protein
MKLTTKQLRNIILEEIQSVLTEEDKNKTWKKELVDVGNRTGGIDPIKSNLGVFVEDYINTMQKARLKQAIDQAEDYASLRDAAQAVALNYFPDNTDSGILAQFAEAALGDLSGAPSDGSSRDRGQEDTSDPMNGIYQKAQGIARSFIKDWDNVGGEAPENPVKLLMNRFNMDNKKALDSAIFSIMRMSGVNIDSNDADMTEDEVADKMKKMIGDFLDEMGTANVTWKKGSARKFENKFLNFLHDRDPNSDELGDRGFGSKLKSLMKGRGFRQ